MKWWLGSESGGVYGVGNWGLNLEYLKAGWGRGMEAGWDLWNRWVGSGGVSGILRNWWVGVGGWRVCVPESVEFSGRDRGLEGVSVIL